MLPIGSFTWSQGLETAVERGWISDVASAGEWMEAMLIHSLASTEGPLLLRLLRALQANDGASFEAWNDMVFALRETMELSNEDREQGALLHKLNRLHYADCSSKLVSYSFVAAFAEALYCADIDEKHGLQGFLWMWTESQLVQTIKLIPLGLKDGQALLDRLLRIIPTAQSLSLHCPENRMGMSLPGRSLASSFHESQYCRIYRS